MIEYVRGTVPAAPLKVLLPWLESEEGKELFTITEAGTRFTGPEAQFDFERRIFSAKDTEVWAIYTQERNFLELHMPLARKSALVLPPLIELLTSWQHMHGPTSPIVEVRMTIGGYTSIGTEKLAQHPELWSTAGQLLGMVHALEAAAQGAQAYIKERSGQFTARTLQTHIHSLLAKQQVFPPDFISILAEEMQYRFYDHCC